MRGALAGVRVCVTTKKRHLNRLGAIWPGPRSQSLSGKATLNLSRKATQTRTVRKTLRGCVTTETKPLDRLGQLGEFEQDSNTDSELESNTDSEGVCRNEDRTAQPVLTTKRFDQKQATQPVCSNKDRTAARPLRLRGWWSNAVLVGSYTRPCWARTHRAGQAGRDAASLLPTHSHVGLRVMLGCVFVVSTQSCWAASILSGAGWERTEMSIL